MKHFCFRCFPKLESAFRFGFDDCNDSIDHVNFESEGFIIRRVSMCLFQQEYAINKNYVSTTKNVDTKNPLKNYITLLIVNKYADE